MHACMHTRSAHLHAAPRAEAHAVCDELANARACTPKPPTVQSLMYTRARGAHLHAAPRAAVHAVRDELADARAGLARTQEQHALARQQLP